jgi:hypothetical protein
VFGVNAYDLPNPEQTYRPKNPVAPKTQTLIPASLALPPRPVSDGRRSVMRGKSTVVVDTADDEKFFFHPTLTLLLLVVTVVVVGSRSSDGSRRSNMVIVSSSKKSLIQYVPIRK